MNNNFSDVASERATLAGIASYGSVVYDDIKDIVSVSSFGDEVAQSFFKCLQHILDRGDSTKIDLASIYQSAQALGFNQLLGKEKDYVRSVLNFPIHASNVRSMALRLRKLEVAKDLYRQHQKAAKDLLTVTGDEPINDIVKIAESPITDYINQLGGAGESGPQRFGDGLLEYIEHLVNNPVTMIGQSTGYAEYDIAIGGGLRGGCLDMVGARPKKGKSVFAKDVGFYISKTFNEPVLMLDGEMDREIDWHRLLANFLSVKINDIETGRFGQNANALAKIKAELNKVVQIPYYYQNIVGKPFDEVLSVMKRWISKTVGLQSNGKAQCTIIFDYFRLPNASAISSNLAEYQALGFQMNDLHNFVVKYGVRCLSMLQLNRDGIDKETTDIIAGSDRIVHSCDSISIMKEKSQEEIAEDKVHAKERWNRKLLVLATRHGAGLDDGDYVNLNLQGEYARIVSGPTRNKLYKLSSKSNEGFVSDDDNQPITVF